MGGVWVAAALAVLAMAPSRESVSAARPAPAAPSVLRPAATASGGCPPRSELLVAIRGDGAIRAALLAARRSRPVAALSSGPLGHDPLAAVVARRCGPDALRAFWRVDLRRASAPPLAVYLVRLRSGWHLWARLPAT